ELGDDARAASFNICRSGSGAAPMSPDLDERPLTLNEAGDLYRLKVSTLRAEAARGRLDIFRLGKRGLHDTPINAGHGTQMPRGRGAPGLYLDPGRRQWVIRAGASFIRTACAESDRYSAEARFAAYLGQKHKPQRSASPLIADVLLAYASEHLPHTRAA